MADTGMVGYATEATLKELLTVNQGQSELLRRVGEKLQANLTGIDQQMNRAAKSADEYAAAQTRSTGLTTAAAEGTKDALTALGTASKTGGNVLDTTLRSAGGGIKDLIRSMPEGSFKNLGLVAEGAAAFIEGNIERYGALNNSINTLYATGVTFDRGMQGMVNSAARVGLQSDQLAGVMAKHAAVVSTMGTENFIRMGEAARNQSDRFAEMGITTPEAMQEAVSSYATLLRNTGRLQHTSAEDVAKDSASYQEQLEKLSQATGRRREDLDREHQDFMAKSRTLLAVAGMSPEARKKFDDGILALNANAGAAGPALQQMVVDLKRSNGNLNLMSDATRQQIIQSGNLQNLQKLQAAVESNDTAAISRITKDMGANFEATAAAQSKLGGAAGEAAENNIQLGTQIKNAGTSIGEHAKGLDDATQQTNKFLMATTEAMNQVKNITDGATASIGSAVTGSKEFAAAVDVLRKKVDDLQLVARGSTGEAGLDTERMKAFARDIMGDTAILAGLATVVSLAATKSAVAALGLGGAPSAAAGGGEGGSAAAAGEQGRAAEESPGASRSAPGFWTRLGTALGLISGPAAVVEGRRMREQGSPIAGTAVEEGGGALTGAALFALLGKNPKLGAIVGGAVVGGAEFISSMFAGNKTTAPAQPSTESATQGPQVLDQTVPAAVAAPRGDMQQEIVSQLTQLNRETMLVLAAIERQTAAVTRTIDRNGSTVN